MPRSTSSSQAAPEIAQAIKHLRRKDPLLKQVIDQVGPFALKQDRRHFAMLVRSIVSQQISTNVAQAIWRRLQEQLQEEGLTPESLRQQTPEQLRSVGISAQKGRYLHDLAEKASDGTICFRSLNRRPNAEIVETLTLVKGIGEWTAQMYLIFSLGRLDVFPWNDLGIRNALQKIYQLEELPDKATSLRLAEPWRPYASVASWYCWRFGDLAKQSTPASKTSRKTNE